MNQNDIDKLLDEMIEEAEREIDKLFAKRLKALISRIEKMYRKYSQGGELTWTDMNKYNRFNKEMALISQEIHSDYKDLYKDIQKLLEDTYIQNYLRSGFLYSFEAQEEMGYSIPSIATVRQAVLNPIAKLTLSALMQEHRNEIIKKINIEVSQGLLNGESYSSMATRIEEATGFASYKARRVARTEAGRVQSISRLESAEQASKHANLQKVWNATLDMDVRTSHRILDDKKADKDGYFHYKGYKAKAPHLFGKASLDINCRCNVLFLVNGKRPELRRARVKDGSAVIPYQSFDTWYKSLNKAS